MRRLIVWDAVGLVGLALVLGSLVLPWSRSQSCPIFEECGPWTTHLGFVGLGTAAGLLALVAGLLLFVMEDTDVARILGLVLLVIAAGLVAFQGFFQDFIIFGNTEAPLFGYLVAWVGLLVSFGGLVTALVRSPTRVPGDPAPSTP